MVFRSYKVALRPQNSHALVNAAHRLTLSEDGAEITDAVVAYGAVGRPTAVRAAACERALLGPVAGAFRRALPALVAEVAVPASVVPSCRSFRFRDLDVMRAVSRDAARCSLLAVRRDRRRRRRAPRRATRWCGPSSSRHASRCETAATAASAAATSLSSLFFRDSNTVRAVAVLRAALLS